MDIFGFDHHRILPAQSTDITTRVVVQGRTARAGSQNRPETGTELAVEEGVKYGVDAGVAGAEPLREGQEVVDEPLLSAVGDRATELDPGDDGVERQPGAGEQHYHDEQHLDDLDLGPVDEHAAVTQALSGESAAAHPPPDEEVAETDEQ